MLRDCVGANKLYVTAQFCSVQIVATDKIKNESEPLVKIITGAGEETLTLDLFLGKEAL